MHLCRTALLVFVGSIVSAPLMAQDDDLAYGLLREAGSEQSPIGVDEDLSFVWDARDGGEPQQIRWRGELLIRNATAYTFHVFLQGEAEVRLDGAVVVSGAAGEPQWVSGDPISLDFGFRPIEVTYRLPAVGGRLHVFWSSDRFPLEPLPPHLLFRAEEDVAPETDERLDAVARGRALFDASRCDRCHRDSEQPLSLPGPALTHLATGLNANWLRDKLLHQHAEAETSRMPAFGLNEADVDALAAFLMDASQPAELPEVPAIDVDPKNPPPEGDLLLNSVGCLACHRVGELGDPGLYGGGDLSRIGSRRTREWIYSKLTDSNRLNPQARMPEAKLTEVERVQLAETLSGFRADDDQPFVDPAPADSALIERGRALFAAARCAACHDLPGQTVDLTGVPSLASISTTNDVEWSKSCLAKTPDRERLRPSYPHVDREALRAALGAGQAAAFAREDEYRLGRLILRRKNCLSCHERGRGTGIVATAGRVARTDPRLAGQSQALIPPNLTAAGDKLLDAALAEAITGQSKSRRMPWLRVRMPRYEHAPEEQQALLSYLIGHDRIPNAAPQTLGVDADAEPDAQTLLTARALVGAGGFSCIACHEFGDYVPPNVAIATHGSDLLGLKSRMRPEFFLRWTRSPLRIVPGMEMPSYERPVPGILDGDVDTQLAALWHALNDPEFTVPTNPTAVEQLLVVPEGTPPRIVRDVFTVSPANGGGYVPRALGIGFDNGHSLLFDLDRATVRDWAIGEFARQRTQGKSWFWDLAGVTVTEGFDEAPGFVLLHDQDEKWVPLDAFDDGRAAHLKEYRVTKRDERDVVLVRYDVAVQIDGETHTIRVTDEFCAMPSEESGVTGVLRSITAENVPEGRRLAVLRPAVDPGEFRVFAGPRPVDTAPVWQAVAEGKLAGPFVRSEDGVQRRTIVYDSAVSQPVRESPPIDVVPTSDTPITTAAGFDGARLKLPAAIMPTAFAWTDDGTLVFTSLKGHVYSAHDSDGDGIEDSLTVVEEGLAAPFGVLPDGEDLLVLHKPELLRLRDTDGDGRTDERIVAADGWGYTHDYHDWSTGPLRDADGNLYIATSSDYTHKTEDAPGRWRGKVLRVSTSGTIEPIAHELRYPIGFALDHKGRIFASDQQGVANTFNEINHIQPGGRYGVKSRGDPTEGTEENRAAVQLPHPWTRSVNGIFFIPQLPNDHPLSDFAGHGIGCEYNGRFLIRFSLDDVDGELQGAAYELTETTWESDESTFLGPICGAVSPEGDLYIGSIFDSGWLGGRNTGEIVRLRPNGEPLPNGMREVRAVPGGFEIEFLRPVDAASAAEPANYEISGYTRVWQGSYATPDSGRYAAEVSQAVVSDDATRVRLTVDDLRASFVYDIVCGVSDSSGERLKPDTAYYTMNQVPEVRQVTR
ncbi:MAG: hypothetical protein DWQ34_01875 [Planctomycetota bacterium]|nr:MAG: hypothetical protein DWQ34_01875 [Planctomycetota bacterium]REK26913.1 MAG: hypothetical protein DWQ41_08735 [Planctomycetota bacterium]REK35402.1 MAG: hypothetical protein DWQ45_11850 [Planctomycetota bacterium]